MVRRVIYTLILFILMAAVPVEAQPNTLGLSDDDYMLLRNASRSGDSLFSFVFVNQLSVEGLDSFAFKADLSGSGKVDLASPALDLIINGTTTLGTTQITPVNTEVRWIDDTLYLNLGNGWQALKPASQFLTQSIGRYIGLSADKFAMKTWDLLGIEGLGEVLPILTKFNPEVFLTANRLADFVGGQSKFAHFRFTIDAQKLMQTDSFVDLVMAFASVQGNDLVVLDYDKLAAFVRANSEMFKGTTLCFDELVNLSDRRVASIGLRLEMAVDPSVGGYSDGPFKVSWLLSLGGITSGNNVSMSAVDFLTFIRTPDGAKTVTAFEFPAQAVLQAPSDGVTQYVFFETIGENEPYWQLFEAKTGDSVTITVRGLGLEFDSSAKLLSADGVTLAENDDHETNAFGLGYPDPQIADFKITKDGQYRAEVHEINGEAGSFVLTVTIKR